MIRKSQPCCSKAGAEVGLLHRFIFGLSRRRTKLLIIYPDFGLTTKLQHIPLNSSADPMPIFGRARQAGIKRTVVFPVFQSDYSTGIAM
jgi:hypothetical protein